RSAVLGALLSAGLLPVHDARRRFPECLLTGLARCLARRQPLVVAILRHPLVVGAEVGPLRASAVLATHAPDPRLEPWAPLSPLSRTLSGHSLRSQSLGIV